MSMDGWGTVSTGNCLRLIHLRRVIYHICMRSTKEPPSRFSNVKLRPGMGYPLLLCHPPPEPCQSGATPSNWRWMPGSRFNASSITRGYLDLQGDLMSVALSAPRALA